MADHRHAAQAYQTASSNRSLREQEADVFRRANGALRAGRSGDGLVRTRALADNRRLWLLVCDLVVDPDNALPMDLRAAIASVGRAVQREMQRPEPDFEFLIAVNENIAAGLSQTIQVAPPAKMSA